MAISLSDKIESMLEQVEKPARYIGGEVGSTDKANYSCRIVLSYPDVYEIGTANQAVQVLYSLINNDTEAWAQRAFCPWTDAAAVMRKMKIPLFSLESWQPVRDADLWGITMQFELTYTNILELLDLAGVPIRSRDRTGADPIVFAGGPAASNPHPMGPFFDFIIIGDGERVIPRVVRIYEESKNLPREEIIGRIAQLDGIFTPGSARTTTRAVVPELSLADAPVQPVVPVMHAVHDRAVLEIMRGCTRGCRFCLAGFWYRPVRERPPDEVSRATACLLEATGYEEASLSSLSTADYSNIASVLRTLAEQDPGVTISLPSLRVDAAVFKLLQLVPVRKGSITFAPEAGSQRLRDVINKQVTDDDIESALTEAFRLGYGTIKLYFMIGLPGETEADLEAIVDVAVAARSIGRRDALSPGRVQINASVSNFVPKPHTPFQWEGMNSRAELERKQKFLRDNMPRKQIRLSMHDIGPSLVEGAVARGGDQTAGAIEAAWRAGARFDAWTEMFDPEAWEQGFAVISSTMEAEAMRSFDEKEALPWDDIDSRVDKKFLLEEKKKAERGEVTTDCRWTGCYSCGVCEGDIEMRMFNV